MLGLLPAVAPPGQVVSVAHHPVPSVCRPPVEPADTRWLAEVRPLRHEAVWKTPQPTNPRA